ncbi:DUF58 domain-containing protein [Puniceicoccus vermicola]|uniref:DUF58 domain-containing protein n=1 Tax=Puniceicoccus vermicola TaxID=388746 RepID=A0A7X1B1K7_9BACT|nr:DUF58 domain-containing protein [Puniceicoccus vermicola]MBC2602833.1 DUF58 domain-containing protein [Puniceicoccus vermicola]
MPIHDVDDLFDADFRKQLEALRLLSRRLVNGRQRAERRSAKRGSSIEFAEYRRFTAGDDWRNIDWNAYARWKQLVLKLFVEEEDLHVHLLLDCTLSMDWGTPAKFDVARKLVAGLAYLALANLDRAGIVPLGNPEHPVWRPSRGRGKFLALLRHLAQCGVNGSNDSLSEIVRQWTDIRPRKGLAILVSDLWGRDEKDAFQALDLLRHARQEVAVLQIVHPEELTIEGRGDFELVDRETGRNRKILVDPAIRKAFVERVKNYERSLASYCRRHGITFLRSECTTSPEETLKAALLSGGFVR